jgi:hypothetical protein
MPADPQDRLLKLIAAISWPLTILILSFFFRRVLTYAFFSLDSYNFFGAHGVLRPVEDVIEDQVARRLREEKEKEKKEELLEKYQEIPDEIVDYMNFQQEEINDLRTRVSELNSNALIERAVNEETTRRMKRGM